MQDDTVANPWFVFPVASLFKRNEVKEVNDEIDDVKRSDVLLGVNVLHGSPTTSGRDFWQFVTLLLIHLKQHSRFIRRAYNSDTHAYTVTQIHWQVFHFNHCIVQNIFIKTGRNNKNAKPLLIIIIDVCI